MVQKNPSVSQAPVILLSFHLAQTTDENTLIQRSAFILFSNTLIKFLWVASKHKKGSVINVTLKYVRLRCEVETNRQRDHQDCEEQQCLQGWNQGVIISAGEQKFISQPTKDSDFSVQERRQLCTDVSLSLGNARCCVPRLLQISIKVFCKLGHMFSKMHTWIKVLNQPTVRRDRKANVNELTLG